MPVRGVFIRAPRITDVGADVRVLAESRGRTPSCWSRGTCSYHRSIRSWSARPVCTATCSRRCEGTPMSGHSKWATIKRKKEATDAKRSNMYAKLLRAVEVAAREGGGNVEGNMTLASAVEKAKSFSVPNDNIDRAIKRGTGDLGGRRAIRGAPLRGVCARRRRPPDRGAHRQPQPNRPGGSARLHPEQRQHGRAGQYRLDVHPQGLDRGGEVGGARRGAPPGARAGVRRRGPVATPRAPGTSSPSPGSSRWCSERWKARGCRCSRRRSR